MRTPHSPSNHKQQGVAAVEFALVAMLFFTILLAIIEIGRMLFIFNTMQEMTRRGAREAVVRWVDAASQADIKSIAVFNGASMPANPDLTAANITITYLQKDGVTEVTTLPGNPANPGDNLSACGDSTRIANCIYYVRVSITGATFTPMMGLFDFLTMPLPSSEVTMHAESLGFTI
jgi:Flp pilus assembly protein TadG